METIEEKMADPEFVASLPRSRKEAAAVGSKIYYTGPCKFGHNSYRGMNNSKCCKCRSLDLLKVFKSRPPEIRAKYKATARTNYNNSLKGKESRIRWAVANPKRMWAMGILASIRRRIKGKNIPFNITNDYIVDMLPDVCPIFGTPFAYSGNKKPCANSPSLDRIVPALGYVVGNIAVISFRANSIKMDANAEEIQKVADWLKLQENKI